jgi:hypothetical protein
MESEREGEKCDKKEKEKKREGETEEGRREKNSLTA